MLHPKAIEKRAVQESNTDLQQGVRARRTPAHLLFLAHPVIDQMVHDRFNMRRGDPAPGGPCLRKARHAAAVTAHIALEFVDCAGDAGEGVGSYAGMFRCPAFDVATQTRELQKCPPRPTAPEYISDPGNPPPQLASTGQGFARIRRSSSAGGRPYADARVAYRCETN